MNLNDGKALQPLNSGIIVLAGVKASNFDEEIRTHPRVVMWSSQEEHWHSKDLPTNTRAVFLTRFIGHAAFVNIVKEARKRQITIFNPMGTGIITRQVRELLALPRPLFESSNPVHVVQEEARFDRIIESVTRQETIVVNKGEKRNKLEPLYALIDFSKTNVQNAEIMKVKATEMGITTTFESLAQLVSQKRRKLTDRTPVPRTIITRTQSVAAKDVDVSVEILDNMIRGLQDMREFLIATTTENQVLRGKLETLKKVFGA